MTRSLLSSFCVVCLITWPVTVRAAETEPEEKPVTIKLLTDWLNSSKDAAPTFTARITSSELVNLLRARTLSIQFEVESYKAETMTAMERVSMEAVIEHLQNYLATTFAGRFDPSQDLIVTRVPEDQRVTIETPGLPAASYTGPPTETIGLLLHDVSEREFTSVALRFIQKARQLLDTGDARYDRSSPDYYRSRAQAIVDERKAAWEAEQASNVEAAEMRKKVAELLGLRMNSDGTCSGEAKWLKESRRFSYIVKEGQFIQRLQPLVDRINRHMELAGFDPPSSLDRPGIHYDPEIGDVDIVLPASVLGEFLLQADAYERRMAEDAIISIEAVRLTDRDIVSGALASRVNATIHGAHDVKRFNNMSVFRELGLNSLLAVANQNLQIRTLSGIGGGTIPDGVSPVQVAPPTLPPINVGRSFTSVGGTFSVGADPIFFDGREQIYGFSYLSPDGQEHLLRFEVVDSLRETWSRIERNLIVHKIKKTGSLTPFSVPVGPDTRTYEGIAALISQENQQLIVATGTGAISEISATAGTWLVIKDFEITPIPGSSTTLTEDDFIDTQSKVMLTMFLRDPRFPVDAKNELLQTRTRDELHARLNGQMTHYGDRSVRSSRRAATYGEVFDKRYKLALEERRFEKREENSVISLTFYSSQGNIIQAPGATQLGDANDLTSFTTLLRPNIVTPISSFFTKSGNATLGSSPLTGADKGEQKNEDKTMTHLVIRARFPTAQRENADSAEGRFVGYFDLPIERKPTSAVDLPFLSSSEHPLERLAKLRVGLMFDVLNKNKVKKPFAEFNPQRFPGSVPPESWETASARVMLIQKIIGDSPGADESMSSDFASRFIVEVRTLLEYDETFFDGPNTALRNMTHWNDPDRIFAALENSPARYALSRLVDILDRLGEILVPADYAQQYLGVSPPASAFKHRRVYDLAEEELSMLQRDVAAHYLRFREAYGDAMLEAVLNTMRLGSYRTTDNDMLMLGPFRGYHDLVVFDKGGRQLGNPQLHQNAHEQFLFLKQGGYKGKMFQKSKLDIEHLSDLEQSVMYRGTDIVKRMEEG